MHDLLGYATATTGITTGTTAIIDFVFPTSDTPIPYMTSLAPGAWRDVRRDDRRRQRRAGGVLFIEYEGAF